MTIAIILLLVAILGGGVWVLRLDARNRRVNQQVATAIGSADAPVASPVLTYVRKDRSGWHYRLARLLLKYDPGAHRYLPMWLTILIGVVAGLAAGFVSQLLVPMWVAGPEAVFVGGFVVRNLLGWQQARYGDRLLRQMPDTIEIITSAVKAGWPVNEAFRAVSREMPTPTREQFAVVVSEMDLGQRVQDALHGIYERSRVSEYAMLSVTLAVQASSGGRLAETLQTLGDAIRERVALAGRAKALASESHLASKVMSSLPFIVAGMLYALNPSFMDMMFTDHRGRSLLAVAIIMLTIGIVSMRRMIKKGTTV